MDIDSAPPWHRDEQRDVAVGLNPCSWLEGADLSVIGNLGCPDPYYWPSLQDWVESLHERFMDHQRIDTAQLRQRFVRLKCVACDRICDDGSSADGVDPPVALPCGHIIGFNCLQRYRAQLETTEDWEKLTCPWRGPTGDDPTSWSKACNTKMFYRCSHPTIFMRTPSLSEDFYLPDDFFIPRMEGRFMPHQCQRCSVKSLLMKWTRELRQEPGMERTFTSCSVYTVTLCPRSHRPLTTEISIDGVLDYEVTDWCLSRTYSRADFAQQKTWELSRFLEMTPTLHSHRDYPTRFVPDIRLYGPCRKIIPVSDQKRHSV